MKSTYSRFLKPEFLQDCPLSPSSGQPYFSENIKTNRSVRFQSVEVHDRIARLSERYPGRIFGLTSVNPQFISLEAWPSEIERCITELGFVGIKLRTVGHALFPASKDGMTELVKAKEDEISEDKLERYYRKTTENLFNIAILSQRLDEQDLRLVTYSVSGRSRVGAVINNLVVDLNLSYSAFLESKGEPFPETKADLELPPKMRSLIAKGMEGLERAKEAILFAQQREFRITGAVFSLPDVKFKAPVTEPSKIVCTGLNYEDYRIKLGLQYLPVPQIFLKAPSSLIGHMEPIVIPQGYGVIFHEWELSCIIAKTCRNVEKEKVGESILGYTIFNDITAHDIESKSRELQPWGKSFDTFAPMGPWIVTPDEMPKDLYNLRMVRRRNGKIETDSNTKNMQFHFDDIISFVSSFWTFNPGDVVTTASPPAGPIAPGDTIEAEIEGIGVLVNPVVSSKTNLEYAKKVGLT